MQAIEMTLEEEARLLNEKAKTQMPEDERRGLVSWQGSAGCSRRGCDKEGARGAEHRSRWRGILSLALPHRPPAEDMLSLLSPRKTARLLALTLD